VRTDDQGLISLIFHHSDPGFNLKPIFHIGNKRSLGRITPSVVLRRLTNRGPRLLFH
jgi:hypothetical protein